MDTVALFHHCCRLCTEDGRGESGNCCVCGGVVYPSLVICYALELRQRKLVGLFETTLVRRLFLLGS